jgi:hypothetical protein
MISDNLSNECGTSKYNIPASVIKSVFVSDLTGNIHPEPWEGLIDTGADRSAVPISICNQLNLAPRDLRFAQGFDHDAPIRELPRYYVRVNVTNIGEFTLLVYGVRRSNILLGRDFLSKLVFICDSSKSKYTLGKHTFWSKLIIPILRLA